MEFSFKIGSLFLSISFLASCVFEMGSPIYVGQKDSCGFAVNQYSGQGLRWNEANFPVPFYLHSSVPYEAKQNFIFAIEHWNLAWAEYLENEGLQPFRLFIVADRHNLYNGQPQRDGSNFLFFIDKNFSRYDSSSGVQAITAMNAIGDEIKDTDILVNEEAFNFYYDSSYNDEITIAKKKVDERRSIASSRAPSLGMKIIERLKEWWSFLLKPFIKKKPIRGIARISPKVPRDKVDFPSLMIHELGHVPGMAHFDGSDRYHSNHNHASRTKRSSRDKGYISVMEPKLPSGKARRQITSYDLENLFCAYFNY
ncbi:MAG: hypothetical protein OXC37_02285 [Bdellovibrionaceae bacterium]|nr:hypothetical protein [Pseudobdellovibrionaceae bacterium]